MEEAEFAWEAGPQAPPILRITSPYRRNSYGLVSFLRGKEQPARKRLAKGRWTSCPKTIRANADDAIVAAEAAEADVPADSPADSPVAARAADDGRNVDFTNTNRWDTRQLVTMALMCAIGVLLSFIEFPLLPGVTWLRVRAPRPCRPW